jgi:uncharacterized membrane protein
MTRKVAPASTGLLVSLGSQLAPPRFVMFMAVLLGVAAAVHFGLRDGWSDALVIGFDVAVIGFTVSLWPLASDHSAAEMRRHSAENDANRGLVLVITAVISLAILLAMIAELPAAHKGDISSITKLILTLVLGWIFTNLIFAMHYAHMFYGAGETAAQDAGGFEFPGTKEPDYWDFIYFSFTAGMSFAASDVNVTSGAVRRVLVVQCLLAFLFNIGALAFCINVLAGAAG